VRRAADDPVAADRGTGIARVAVVLAHVHAVGVARLHEVGTVVEDEERAGGIRGGPERARRAHERGVVERLVAQLDDVDAAAQRSVQEQARALLADQVQARGGDPLAGAHGSSQARLRANLGWHTGARKRAERAPPGRRPSNLIRVVPA
jgi:hypothetical protein